MAVDGTWYNELGSSMTIQRQTSMVVTGTYTNAAGQASGNFNLVGSLDPSPANSPGGPNQAVAWTVVWLRIDDGADFNSVTAWSGQYQFINGEEVITAMWLLTSETIPSLDWRATIVGQDIFTRNLPKEEAIARRLKTSAWSHPAK